MLMEHAMTDNTEAHILYVLIVKAASDAVGRHIAAAMGGGISGDVVDLPKSRRANPKLER